MHKWMRQDENAHEAEGEPEESELQNCERWISSAEGQAEEGQEAESAMRLRHRSDVFSRARRSRCSVNARLKDGLDEHFEYKVEDEAQQIFHVAAYEVS
jgi:hypothetical protein